MAEVLPYLLPLLAVFVPRVLAQFGIHVPLIHGDPAAGVPAVALPPLYPTLPQALVLTPQAPPPPGPLSQAVQALGPLLAQVLAGLHAPSPADVTALAKIAPLVNAVLAPAPVQPAAPAQPK